MDAIRYQRDKALPNTLNRLRRQEILLQQYGLRGKEETHRARDDLFSVQNSRKALLGMLAGLQDPQVLSDKAAAEKALLAAIDADAKLQPLASAWKTITETSARRADLLGDGVAVNSHLFGIALQPVQMAEEDQKPSEERLPQFADAGRESLLQQLYSEAPIYTDLEQVLLADSISKTLEQRGFDDSLSQQILAGKSPSDRAAELVSGTKLLSVEDRKKIGAGGIEAINNSRIR